MSKVLDNHLIDAIKMSKKY